MLKEVVNFSGWNWQACSFVFPKRLMLEMKATLVPFSARNFDRITWSSSPRSNFEMMEAYKLARVEAEGNCNDNFDGEWIWRVPTIPKIKCFLWQCYHKSIPVSSLLANRGMDIPTIFQLCNSSSETILHVLRDCQVARNLWIALSPPLTAVSFFVCSSLTGFGQTVVAPKLWPLRMSPRVYYLVLEYGPYGPIKMEFCFRM